MFFVSSDSGYRYVIETQDALASLGVDAEVTPQWHPPGVFAPLRHVWRGNVVPGLRGSG